MVSSFLMSLRRYQFCTNLLFCLGYRQANGSRVALTSGDWEVLGQQIWVDLEYGIVYFLGLREGPLEKHLYGVSLRNPGEIRLLSKPGHSYNVDFSEVCN